MKPVFFLLTVFLLAPVPALDAADLTPAVLDLALEPPAVNAAPGPEYDDQVRVGNRLKERTFVRNHIVTRDGRLLLPFRHYIGPDDQQDRAPLDRDFTNPRNGVLISSDGGETWTEHWISFDGMQTWPYQRVLHKESCDGLRGRINYPDGFVSADREWLHFAFDDNRHRAVHYSAKLPPLK